MSVPERIVSYIQDELPDKVDGFEKVGSDKVGALMLLYLQTLCDHVYSNSKAYFDREGRLGGRDGYDLAFEATLEDKIWPGTLPIKKVLIVMSANFSKWQNATKKESKSNTFFKARGDIQLLLDTL